MALEEHVHSRFLGGRISGYAADLAILALFSAILYLPAVSQSFVSDDFLYLRLAGEPGHGRLERLLLTPSPYRYYRPLEHVSFALDLWLAGLRPVAYHITNIAIHIVFCLLLIAAYGWCAPGDAWTRRSALVLFLVHPFHATSVVWISGRADLLCATFLLGALAVHFGPWRARGIRRWAASLGLFLAALGSKELAFVFPLMVFVLEWARTEEGVPGRHPHLDAPGDVSGLGVAVRRAIPYAVVMAGFLAVRWGVLGSFGRLGDTRSSSALFVNVAVAPFLGFVPIELSDPRASWLLGYGTPLRSAILFLLFPFLAASLLFLWRMRQDRPLRLASAFTLASLLTMATGLESWRYYVPSAGIALLSARLIASAATRGGRSVSRGKQARSEEPVTHFMDAPRNGRGRWLATALVAAFALLGSALQIQRISDMDTASEIGRRAITSIIQETRTHPGTSPLLIFHAPYVYRNSPTWSDPNVAAQVLGEGFPRALTVNFLILSSDLIGPEWSVTGPGEVRVRADPARGVLHFAPATAARGKAPFRDGPITTRVLERDRMGRPLDVLLTVDRELMERHPVALAWSPEGLHPFDLEHVGAESLRISP